MGAKCCNRSGIVLVWISSLAALVHGEEEEQPHLLVKRSGNEGWFKNPGSPTWRKSIKDDIGQQIDFTHNPITGQRTSGYLAKGKQAREDSPKRQGQPHSGGEASTSQKKGKKRGH